MLSSHFHLVAGGRPRRLAGKLLLSGLQKPLRPILIQALSEALAAVRRGDRLLTASLSLSRVLLCGRTTDVPNDLLRERGSSPFH